MHVNLNLSKPKTFKSILYNLCLPIAENYSEKYRKNTPKILKYTYFKVFFTFSVRKIGMYSTNATISNFEEPLKIQNRKRTRKL